MWSIQTNQLQRAYMIKRGSHQPHKAAQRGELLLALISLIIFLLGVGTLFSGGLHYPNWWGGLVFAPFAILIGTAGLLIAAFAPMALRKAIKREAGFAGGPPERRATIENVIETRW
jgi:hypothetical protein